MDAWNVWQVGQDGNLIVGEKEKSHKARPAISDTSESADVPKVPPISKIAAEPADLSASHVHSTADESVADVTPTSEAQDPDQAKAGQSTQENELGVASTEIQGPSSPLETVSGTNVE
jgi:hypothetical protein